MPLKPHPTDPNKMVYVKAEYNLPSYNLPPKKRTLAKIQQAAWNAVHKDYKDDPECCFALGFDAGYDAVAQRVEPPEMESGGGFKSLPASPIAWITFNAYGEEDDIWYENPNGHLPEGWTYKPLYTAPPKKEWVGLTEKEIMASLPSALRAPPLKMPPGWRQFADALEAMLKEKNYGNN